MSWNVGGLIIARPNLCSRRRIANYHISAFVQETDYPSHCCQINNSFDLQSTLS